MAAPMAAAVLPALLKTGIGLAQFAGGVLTKRPKRPTYTVPGAITQTVQATQQQANVTQRPGASSAQAVINTNTANTVDTIQNVGGSASNVMQGLVNAQAQENRAMLNETARNEAFRYQGFQDKIRSLQMLGQYQDKAWDWNQKDNYIEKSQKRRALISAGLQNLTGGAEDAVATGILTNTPTQTSTIKPQHPFQNRTISVDRDKLEADINSSIQNRLRGLGVNQRNLAIF